MTNIPDEPAYQKNVIELLTVANEYCLFIERMEKYDLNETLRFLLRLSPLLYLKGSLLPKVEIDDSLISERFVTEEHYEEIFNNLRTKLLDQDVFWYIDYSRPDDNDPVKGSLSEYFADIYQDLKDFVILYQRPLRASKQNAVADCYELFRTRWGPRILTINSLIHYMVYKDESDTWYDDILNG